MKYSKTYLFIWIIFLFLAVVLLPAHTWAGEGPVKVLVSIPPQKYFVEQIGKDLVDVRIMVQPGASPATYEPRPRQMAGLSEAEVYFAVGVPFEKVWLKKFAAASQKMKVIHTDQGIRKIPMAIHGTGHEQDKEGEDHEHGILDPHIWLSPPLVKIQARSILAALQDIDPSHRSVYAANFREFSARIDQLDADLKKTFDGKKGLAFMVFHPSWGYFAQAYGLKQVPIEIEGKKPKPAQLKEMIEHAREKGIRVVFVQPQFSSRSAKLIAGETGGQIVFADPLAEDWLTNLRTVADNFKAALR